MPLLRDAVRAARRAARRLRALAPVRIRRGPAAGLRMDLRRASAWYASGDNEIPVQEAIVANLSEGGVFLDVGANVGFFSLVAARVVGPSGTVVAFEPVPENASAAERNAALNSFARVRVVQAAVGAAPGRMTLHVTRHPGGAALASSAAPPDRVNSIEVEVVSLDAAFESGRVPPPDLVKIDVEGAELDVLRGMSGLAARCGPSILCEFDGPSAADVRPRLDAALELFADWGYSVRRLESSYSGAWEVVHVLAVRTPPARS